jgi:hypothetical protein
VADGQKWPTDRRAEVADGQKWPTDRRAEVVRDADRRA